MSSARSLAPPTRVASLLVALLAGVLALAGAAAAADPTPYQLAKPASFGYGCYGPCLCPVQVTDSLRGGFGLQLVGVSADATAYEITGVDWGYPARDGAGDPYRAHVTGNGLYQVNGGATPTHRMTLSLSFDGGAPQPFDSGFVPQTVDLPGIDIDVWSNPVICHDTLLHVAALPAGSVGVSAGATLRLLTAPAPNPGAGVQRLALAAPVAGHAKVEVFGLDGRRVARLLDAEVTPGVWPLVWDGRDARGRDAGAGTYFVRATLAGAVDRRTVIRLAAAGGRPR